MGKKLWVGVDPDFNASVASIGTGGKTKNRKSRTKPHTTRSWTVGPEPLGVPALPEPLAGRRATPFGWGAERSRE